MTTPLLDLDPAAAYGMEGKPFIFMYFALFFIVLLRSHATYWAARGAVVGGTRLLRRRRSRLAAAQHAAGNSITQREDADADAEAGPDAADGSEQSMQTTTPEIQTVQVQDPKWVHDWKQSRHAARARRFVDRWGPLAVFFCYFTVGFQSAVLITAGLARMNYARFVAASVPASLGWAAIWSTAGLAAVWGAIKVAGENWWVVLLGAVIAVGLVIVARKRRSAEPI